jgi:hypothetical protein
MNTIIKYHSKYLKFITKKLRFDPIALLIALIFFDDLKTICITYILLLSLIHLPLIIYKNYNKNKIKKLEKQLF